MVNFSLLSPNDINLYADEEMAENSPIVIRIQGQSKEMDFPLSFDMQVTGTATSEKLASRD